MENSRFDGRIFAVIFVVCVVFFAHSKIYDSQKGGMRALKECSHYLGLKGIRIVHLQNEIDGELGKGVSNKIIDDLQKLGITVTNNNILGLFDFVEAKLFDQPTMTVSIALITRNDNLSAVRLNFQRSDYLPARDIDVPIELSKDSAENMKKILATYHKYSQDAYKESAHDCM